MEEATFTLLDRLFIYFTLGLLVGHMLAPFINDTIDELAIRWRNR